MRLPSFSCVSPKIALAAAVAVAMVTGGCETKSWLNPGEVGRFHHIVLLVPTQTMLRPKRRSDGQPRCHQRIERMDQFGRHRSGMGQQGDAAALELREKRGVGEQPIDTEFHKLSLLAAVRP